MLSPRRGAERKTFRTMLYMATISAIRCIRQSRYSGNRYGPPGWTGCTCCPLAQAL